MSSEAGTTASGLMLMPMMFGMLITSILSGRIISRWGRYKLFPVAGTAIMTLGLVMLSRLSLESYQWQTSLDALWLGLGMGMVMQVLILAVQNSIEYKYLGVATSGTMLFRSVGGALGVALFGATFASELHARLGPERMDFLTSAVPAAVQGLPPVMHREYIDAVMAALRPVFVVVVLTLSTRSNCAIPLRRKDWPRALQCRAMPHRWRSSSASSRC